MSGGAAKSVRIGAYATRVVAFAALAIGAVVLLLVIAASKDTREVHAVFDDVRGLIPGGDVTAGAVVVGGVTDVRLNEDGDPEVTMEIADEFKLYEGAFADIRLGSNIGAVNRVVDLKQGDPSLPELADGATLRGAQTDQPVDFDLAVSTLTPEVRGQIKKILVGLDEGLLNRGPDFDQTLRHSATTLAETANLLHQVNRDGEALRTIVSEGERVLSALAASPEDLGEAAERTATLLSVTANRQVELAETTQLLGPALAGGRQLFDRAAAAAPNLRTLVADARPLVDELGPFARLIPPATDAAGPFIEQAAALVGEAPDQLRAQRELLRIAPPLIGRLSPLLDRLNPVSDYLRVFAPETVGFFQNVADASANYDINGHMIRTLAGPANELPPSSASAGAIGPSECGPGLLQPPYHRTPGVLQCDPWDDFEQSLIGGDR